MRIQCDWQKSHNNLLSELGLDNPRECPRAFDPSDKIFCCSKDGGNSIYCCGASEFGKAGWIGSLGIVIIAAGAVFMMLVCCMCCICCPCCPLYKRRHRGTVYGSMYLTICGTHSHSTLLSLDREGHSSHFTPLSLDREEHSPQYTAVTGQRGTQSTLHCCHWTERNRDLRLMSF
uniref:Uncharacterized protein n=1 Tax=Timema poppense TaxID=170557 RepID=A0A7R9DPA6_TIMPO|nr:unnamed protein product [Timema poppensis]